MDYEKVAIAYVNDEIKRVKGNLIHGYPNDFAQGMDVGTVNTLRALLLITTEEDRRLKEAILGAEVEYRYISPLAQEV